MSERITPFYNKSLETTEEEERPLSKSQVRQMTALGHAFLEAREHAGWSYKQAADESDVSVTTIKKLESGTDINVRLDTLFRYAALYGRELKIKMAGQRDDSPSLVRKASDSYGITRLKAAIQTMVDACEEATRSAWDDRSEIDHATRILHLFMWAMANASQDIETCINAAGRDLMKEKG